MTDYKLHLANACPPPPPPLTQGSFNAQFKTSHICVRARVCACVCVCVCCVCVSCTLYNKQPLRTRVHVCVQFSAFLLLWWERTLQHGQFAKWVRERKREREREREREKERERKRERERPTNRQRDRQTDRFASVTTNACTCRLPSIRSRTSTLKN